MSCVLLATNIPVFLDRSGDMEIECDELRDILDKKQLSDLATADIAIDNNTTTNTDALSEKVTLREEQQHEDPVEAQKGPIKLTVTSPGFSRTFTPCSENESDTDTDVYEDAEDSRSNTPSSLMDLDVSGLNEDKTPREEEVAKELTAEEKAELYENIVAQIDFYFGDSNFPKDRFLRRQASEGDGYVTMDIVCSFKKMKRLTKNREWILEAVKASKVVELSEDETKVKRRLPVPADPEDSLTRTVVVENIHGNATPESMRELCEQFGKVVRVRLVDPKVAIPDDVRKYTTKSHHGRKNKLHSALRVTGPPCALVEFELIEDCEKACTSLTNSDDWRMGLRVSILYLKEKKKKKKKKKTGEDGEKIDGDASDCSDITTDDDGNNTDEKKGEKKNKSPLKHLKVNPGRVRSNSWDNNKQRNKKSCSQSPLTNRRELHSAGNTPRSSPFPNSRKSGNKDEGLMMPINLNISPRSSPTSMLRREMRSDSPSWRSNSPWKPSSEGRRLGDARRSESPMPRNMEGILRMPKGPEGKAFSCGRGGPIMGSNI